MGVVAALRAFVVWIGRSFFEAVIRSEVTPNQITMAGFAMVLTNCLLYLWHRDMYVLGVGLSLSYTFDALDGAVARRRGMESRFGGYLDSVIDRYQEVAAYIVIGLVQGWWLELYVLTIGCLLISYNKAAAAIQMPVDDKGWPDLMERARRTWVFCAALILENAIPIPDWAGGSFVRIAIWYLAVLTHFTALQRIMRARRLLVLADRS